MILADFYNIINNELLEILQNNAADERTKQHKNIDLNKGYALLVWFLRFYGQKDLYQSHITDGKDDSSCDIIFSNKTMEGETIFYVIQSKYVKYDTATTKEDAYPKIPKQEFGSTLNDFSIILSQKRTLGQNKNFNEKYEALKLHLENNGKVKFIFFTLANINEDITDAVSAFNKQYAPNVELEILDMVRIRRDFIEFRYKEIKTSNPLAYTYSSEDNLIELNIERLINTNRDIFEFEGRTKAFTFLLKPKTLHDLFQKYGFSLFFKNVRNPIHRSNYNPKIIETLLKKPDAFWYFNNGITAITKILPNIGVHAKKIKIEGLQIINGAQTVYSVYCAYRDGTNAQRKTMDTYAKISIRLIASSDEDFNLQITRYTNFQNPMHDRDFWANDEVQQRLQNESFKTNLWYEKRHHEFQLSEQQQKDLNISIIPNKNFIYAYIAFHLQYPNYVVSLQNYIFVSEKDDKNGLYEYVFYRNNIQFEEVYAAYFVAKLLMEILKTDNLDGYKWWLLAASKIIMQKYFTLLYDNQATKSFNLNRHIVKVGKSPSKENIAELKKILVYTNRLINYDVVNAYHNAYNTWSKTAESIVLDIKAIQQIDLSTS
jgi:hypothetical protein